MCSFDKSFDVSSLQRARREKAAVGGGSKPVYNYNPSAPEPHLFSATFNVTSTATQFILTASSSAGMAAIRDVVSSAIATAMDNDTYTSTPKNVQIVSLSGGATIGELSNGDVTKTTTSPTCTNTQVPSSTTSSQTLEDDISPLSASPTCTNTQVPSSPTSSQTLDDDISPLSAAEQMIVDTVYQWEMFMKDPKSNPYPDPRVYTAHVDSLGFAKDLRGYPVEKAWSALKKILRHTKPLGKRRPKSTT